MAIVQPANQRLTQRYRGQAPPTLFVVALAACGYRLPGSRAIATQRIGRGECFAEVVLQVFGADAIGYGEQTPIPPERSPIFTPP